MVYITFNDVPSGIYFSQVTDVCRYLNSEFKVRIRLLAFVSIRSFRSDRLAIRSEFPDAIVIPMVPKLRLWRLNVLSLFAIMLFLRPSRIMARGPYASRLALAMRLAGLTSFVCFDARGAYAAELTEYEVVKNETLKKEIKGLEKEILEKSDFRLAVSESLVNYWKTKYGYTGLNHVVIPCTMASDFLRELPSSEAVLETRNALGFAPSDVVLVYSGSSAGWQSFGMVNRFLNELMTQDDRIKVLFLAKQLPEELSRNPIFSGRLVQRWVKPREVRSLLCACDFGLIIRERSVTNEVSSPVKFAEYLSCGLRILISPHIGDYSEFVRLHQCGSVLEDMKGNPSLHSVSRINKEESNSLARSWFSKDAYRESYQKLIA
jgi:hypothetical protein